MTREEAERAAALIVAQVPGLTASVQVAEDEAGWLVVVRGATGARICTVRTPIRPAAVQECPVVPERRVKPSAPHLGPERRGMRRRGEFACAHGAPA